MTNLRMRCLQMMYEDNDINAIKLGNDVYELMDEFSLGCSEQYLEDVGKYRIGSVEYSPIELLKKVEKFAQWKLEDFNVPMYKADLKRIKKAIELYEIGMATLDVKLLERIKGWTIFKKDEDNEEKVVLNRTMDWFLLGETLTTAGYTILHEKINRWLNNLTIEELMWVAQEGILNINIGILMRVVNHKVETEGVTDEKYLKTVITDDVFKRFMFLKEFLFEEDYTNFINNTMEAK